MPEVRPAPSAPFSEWPAQLYVPEVGFYWYCQPATLVCQTVVRHATLEVVDAHNGVLDRLLPKRGDEIRGAGGILLFNDWRSLQSLAPGARSRQQERMRARGRAYARRIVVVVSPANRLLRMAVEASSLFATLLFRARIELALSPDALLAQLEVRSPLRGTAFPK